MTEVVKHPEQNRYELVVDGSVAGFADYREAGDRVVMPHTVVDPVHRGKGLAAVLVRHALDDIAASGRRVVPACSFVADFIDRHPDYRSLVADTRPDGR